MTATVIFPFEQWLENTNQNSTPANDNSLRVQALLAPALGFAAAAPSSPANYDQYVVSATWSGFAVNNIVIYVNGTWKEFASYSGMFKSISGVPMFLHSTGYWDTITTTGS